MKKIIIIIIMIVAAISSIYLFDNTKGEASSAKPKIKKKISNVKKEDYKYITTDTDNIEELLKEEENVVTKVNYEYEEPKEELVEEVIIKNGFIEEEGNLYYYENDNKVIGEKEIDGSNYYFDENGILQKNIFLEKKYFKEDGKQVLGFYDIDNKTYYFEKDGYVIGNKKVEDNIYYFSEEGVMQKDIVIENCYYDETGKLYVGFKEIDGNTFYFTKEGISKGITEIDDKKYYFDEEGHLIKSSFYDKYYLDEDGVIVTGQREIGGRTYIFNENGEIQNGFQVVDGNTYFLDEYMNPLKGLQLIDNTRYYFDFESGILIKKDVKSVIDISSWQGDIDFDELKNSNLIDGVIVRLGYGTTLNDSPVLDNKFKRNISELKRLEIPYGVYFFGYAQNEYASNLEADFVNNSLKEVDAKLSYPIFYDAELNEFDGVKYTKTLYRKVINNFVSKLNDYGYKDVGLYGNLHMLSNGSLSFSKKYPVWVAQYFNKCEYDKEYVGWQYTSDGNIPGVNGRVDMNIFY